MYSYRTTLFWPRPDGVSFTLFAIEQRISIGAFNRPWHVSLVTKMIYTFQVLHSAHNTTRELNENSES